MSASVKSPVVHHDFGIKDEKGRAVGLLTWTVVCSARTMEVEPDAHGYRCWKAQPCDPYLVVDSHAARDGKAYGAAFHDLVIGNVSDPATAGKAQAEIDRRVRETRKRYERKYRKA